MDIEQEKRIADFIRHDVIPSLPAEASPWERELTSGKLALISFVSMMLINRSYEKIAAFAGVPFLALNEKLQFYAFYHIMGEINLILGDEIPFKLMRVQFKPKGIRKLGTFPHSLLPKHLQNFYKKGALMNLIFEQNGDKTTQEYIPQVINPEYTPAEIY
jgi:hypothetical protein